MCGGSWAHREAGRGRSTGAHLFHLLSHPSSQGFSPSLATAGTPDSASLVYLCVSGRLTIDSGKWIWLVGAGCVTLAKCYS